MIWQDITNIIEEYCDSDQFEEISNHIEVIITKDLEALKGNLHKEGFLRGLE